ncbi:hypothetical protein ON010_g14524 [Phytophthora cinnamomi]|nr:hypothetical protein ON010_g14524 [Phytophthora cinnamomi]
MSLPLIYPLYIYGFVSLTGTGQVLFVAVLPIIKLVTRNWMNVTLRGYDDIKPETIVFTVEIFNALYISSALQSSTSWTSTVTIMVLDVVGLWVSMVDITEVLKGMRELMDRIPQDHPLAGENFIQLSLRILETDKGRRQIRGSETFISSANAKTPPSKAEGRKSGPTSMMITSNNAEIQKYPRSLRFQSAQVTPMCTGENRQVNSQVMIESNTADAIDTTVFFSRAEQDHFIRKSTHILFITEYVVLTEFAEVVVPILYCTESGGSDTISVAGLMSTVLHFVCAGVYRVVLFYLPNSVYYPSLAGLSSAQLLASTVSMLAYSSFEFLSFVVSITVMKRALGFSPLQQLGFALESQAGSVQTKLMGIFTYVTQMPLVHLGELVSQPIVLHQHLHLVL